MTTENVSAPSISEMIERSLVGGGAMYDVAQVVYHQFREKYVCAKIKSRQWFFFDGRKWTPTEIGIYPEISHAITQLYATLLAQETVALSRLQELIQKKQETLKAETEKEASKTEAVAESERLTEESGVQRIESVVRDLQNQEECLARRVQTLNVLVNKLKNVNYKETLCKECAYIFYQSDFLAKLDRKLNLISFRNGVLDMDERLFRPAVPSDYCSLMIDDDYFQPTEAFQQKIQNFVEFRRDVLAKRKTPSVFS